MEAVRLQGEGRLAEAREICETVLLTHPHHFEALHMLGVIAGQMSEFPLAATLIAKAIELNPAHASCHSNLGIVLGNLGDLDAAIAAFDRAIELAPHFAEAHFNRGNALLEARRWEAATESYERAISIKPRLPAAYCNRGVAMAELGRLDEAVASYDSAISMEPDYVEALVNRAIAETRRKRLDSALANYSQALAFSPKHDFLLGDLLHTKMRICDWGGFEEMAAALKRAIEKGERASPVFPLLALFDCPELHRQAAEIWAAARCPSQEAMGRLTKARAGDRIRVCYVSGDFREHPVSHLMAEVFELHDRSRFEVIAASCSPRSHSTTFARLLFAFDRFIDVNSLTDEDAARHLRELGVDIAVDLSGFTAAGRPGIFSYRAAPVQVGYIGYPGTTGAAFMDYLIADAVIVPPGSERHYSEQLAYLPSYQANDSKRLISDKAFSREELGLPEGVFVYCCFNNTFKITPDVFESWMRILKAVPRSVLLLYAENAHAQVNLRNEASARGVSADRLVFGEKLARPEYLARYKAADLFLDTSPYNGGATVSDALWACLPALTCIGRSFAARMAASLLTAIGLPELIAQTRASYEGTAIALARDPARLAEIRAKLAANRLVAPLFDSRLFTANLESAYISMFERSQRGLPPGPIHVPAQTRKA